MNEIDNVWVCDRSSVEDAKEGTVFGRRVLSRWGEDPLDASRGCLNLASVMRVEEMHIGPGLQWSQCGLSCIEDREWEHTNAIHA